VIREGAALLYGRTHDQEAMQMLRELRRWVIALAVVSAITVPVAYGSVTHTPSPTGLMGYVQLNDSELITPDLIRAFVPTGSKDQRCLVTFSETTIDSVGPAPFCGARTVNGVAGLLITIPLEEPVDHVYLAFTVFQQFARSYGPPTLYSGT
jgi:hypothetical protein